MYDGYINCCNQQLTLDIENMDFKRNINYNGVLEHVSKIIGEKYLSVIKNKFEYIFQNNIELLKELCELNDKYGKPFKFEFKDFILCSPTNLRYILHSLLILEYIKEKKLNNINFIEIGGGYGGLCLFIYKLAPLFDINIDSFTIFDLLEVTKLQELYLNSLDIKNVKYYQLNNFDKIENNSFLISCYAFSEISKEIQNEYINKIINPYVNYGFISWNSILVYNFSNKSVIEVEDEYPNSGDQFNKYVKFYPKSIN